MWNITLTPYVTKSSSISAVAFLPTGFGVGVVGKGEPLRGSLQCQPTCRESQRPSGLLSGGGKEMLSVG